MNRYIIKRIILKTNEEIDLTYINFPTRRDAAAYIRYIYETVNPYEWELEICEGDVSLQDTIRSALYYYIARWQQHLEKTRKLEEICK